MPHLQTRLGFNSGSWAYGLNFHFTCEKPGLVEELSAGERLYWINLCLLSFYFDLVLTHQAQLKVPVSTCTE